MKEFIKGAPTTIEELNRRSDEARRVSILDEISKGGVNVRKLIIRGAASLAIAMTAAKVTDTILDSHAHAAIDNHGCLVEANTPIQRLNDGTPIFREGVPYGIGQLWGEGVDNRLRGPNDTRTYLVKSADGCSTVIPTDIVFSGFYQGRTGDFYLIKGAKPVIDR